MSDRPFCAFKYDVPSLTCCVISPSTTLQYLYDVGRVYVRSRHSVLHLLCCLASRCSGRLPHLPSLRPCQGCRLLAPTITQASRSSNRASPFHLSLDPSRPVPVQRPERGSWIVLSNAIDSIHRYHRHLTIKSHCPHVPGQHNPLVQGFPRREERPRSECKERDQLGRDLDWVWSLPMCGALHLSVVRCAKGSRRGV